MSKVVSRECKFVLHAPPLDGTDLDLHFVKEWVTYDDGRIEPSFRVIPDFQRPFWITMEHYRNHNDKKESESLDRLVKYKATQNTLHRAIATRLGSRYIGAKSMRDISNSPYVYGTDIDSRAVLKKMYLDKYPDAVSSNKLAVLDIEVDVEEDKMLVISICNHSEVYIAILDSFIPNKRKLDEQLMYLYEKYIPETDISKNIKPVFELFDNELDMLKSVINRLHKWKPDFVAIWNIDYDIPYLIKLCKRFGVDPKDIFSDPSLPEEYRYFWYKQGKKVKLTESGVHKPIDPHEQWHTVQTPCSWYWIDAMCAYYYIRVGGKKIPGGYSLNNILEKELGSNMKKLKFEDTTEDGLLGVDWHKYMVKNKPLEYIIYNAWDTMSILELDNKTKDLSNTISVLAGWSSYDIFDSGPKKIIDAMHYFYLDNGRVLGIKGSKEKEEEDLGLSEWIMILNSDFVPESKLKVIEEEGVKHNIRSAVFDLDAVSSYPSDTRAANVSKDTTSRILIGIEGFDKIDFMKQNINLFFGKVNSGEYCTTMMNFPTYDEMLNKIKEKRKIL